MFEKINWFSKLLWSAFQFLCAVTNFTFTLIGRRQKYVHIKRFLCNCWVGFCFFFNKSCLKNFKTHQRKRERRTQSPEYENLLFLDMLVDFQAASDSQRSAVHHGSFSISRPFPEALHFCETFPLSVPHTSFHSQLA